MGSRPKCLKTDNEGNITASCIVYFSSDDQQKSTYVFDLLIIIYTPM